MNNTNSIRVEDLCKQVISGGTPSRRNPDYFSGNIPWVKTMDLNDNQIRDTDESLTQQGLENSSAKLLPPDTTLIAMYGATVGKTGYLNFESSCNQATCAMIPDTTTTNPHWLFYAVQYTKDRLVGLASGAAQQNLNVSLVKNHRIPYHSLAKQNSIAEILTSLDDKINSNQKLINVGQKAIRAQWDLIEASGEMTTLSRIADISPRMPTVKSGSATYLDMKNLPEHGLLVSEWGEREPKGGARFQNGDTLLARITPCFENGKAAWVDFLDEGETAYGSTEYIVLRAKLGIPEIAPYLIGTSAKFRDFAAKHRTGTSGRQRVQAKELANYPAQLPDAESIKRFDGFATPLLKRLGAARNESRALAATRDELLPLLMSGKITVKDAEKRAEDEV